MRIEKIVKFAIVLIIVLVVLAIYEVWAGKQVYIFTQKMNVTYSIPEVEPKEFLKRMSQVEHTLKKLKLNNSDLEGKRFRLSCVNDKNTYTIVMPHEELLTYLEGRINKSITMRIKYYGYYSVIQSGYFITRIDEEKYRSFLTYHHKSAFCPGSAKTK